MRHVVVVVVEHVGQHQRGAFEPRQLAQRGEVGLQDEIAVALVPARRRVARHRLHVDVVGEQVVAGVRLGVRAVDEILGLEALADEAALHVDHGHQHGIDGAGRDLRLQLVEPEIAGHVEPHLVIPGLVPGIQPSSIAGASGTMDPGHKPGMTRLICRLGESPSRILDGGGDDVEGLQHLRLGDGQRRRQGEHVAHGGLERQAAVERGVQGRLGQRRGPAPCRRGRAPARCRAAGRGPDVADRPECAISARAGARARTAPTRAAFSTRPSSSMISMVVSAARAVTGFFSCV